MKLDKDFMKWMTKNYPETTKGAGFMIALATMLVLGSLATAFAGGDWQIVVGVSVAFIAASGLFSYVLYRIRVKEYDAYCVEEASKIVNDSEISEDDLDKIFSSQDVIDTPEEPTEDASDKENATETVSVEIEEERVENSNPEIAPEESTSHTKKEIGDDEEK